VVTSKLKQYVRARSGFNTSDRVADVLSDVLRELCDGAIDRARAEGRRTVMERDFEEP
jgi:histone H3/H4